jgi:hypothetical protein
MHRIATLCLILTVATQLSYEATAEQSGPVVPRLFDVTLPPDASLQRDEGPDFWIYLVAWGSGVKLRIYEGCCPQTFRKEGNALKEDVTINGLVGSVATLEQEGRISKEWHIRVQSGQMRWFLHAWYTALEPADAAIADGIVASIKPKAE